MKSEETRRKMSESAKARCTQEWRDAKSLKYRARIDDARLIALHLNGGTQMQIANDLGVSRKVIENAIRRLGLTPHKAAKRNQTGPMNDNWKGVEAGIVCKHKRLYRAFGQPSRCDVCGTSDPLKTYDWANLSGNYDDPNDFKRMCRSCHSKYDSKHINFKGGK